MTDLKGRADALATQLASRGPEKFSTSVSQPLAPAPKLHSRPWTATDSLELAQRSRAFAATLVALRGAADGTTGGCLLPDISTSGGGRASYNHTLSASRLPAMPRLDRLTNAFVNDFKRAHKQRPACLKIQAAWRMHVQRRQFLGAIRLRRETMRPPLRAWRRFTMAAAYARRGLLRATLGVWRSEALFTLRLLSHLAASLEQVDGRGSTATAAARAWRAFRDERVHGAQPAPARAVVAALQRCAVAARASVCVRAWRGLAATACARRRQAGQRLRHALRPYRRWPSETVLLALLMWSRWAKYRICSRMQRPGPTYTRFVPQWDEWESLQLQRDVRHRLADELFDTALLRRLLRAWVASLPFAGQWVPKPSTLVEDSAPLTLLAARKARLAPSGPTAPAERRPQQLRSGQDSPPPLLHHQTRGSSAKLGAAEQMHLQAVCGTALRRMHGLVQYKRSRRGFFRLLLASWQQWARAHRESHLAAAAATKRSRLASLEQSHALLRRHTAYRRRLGAAALLRWTSPTEARRHALVALYEWAGHDAHGGAFRGFYAWRRRALGARALRAVWLRLLRSHTRRLLAWLVLRWHAAAAAARLARRSGIAAEQGLGEEQVVTAAAVAEDEEAEALRRHIMPDATAEGLSALRLAYEQPPPAASDLAALFALGQGRYEPHARQRLQVLRDVAGVDASLLLWHTLVTTAPALLRAAATRREQLLEGQPPAGARSERAQMAAMQRRLAQVPESMPDTATQLAAGVVHDPEATAARMARDRELLVGWTRESASLMLHAGWWKMPSRGYPHLRVALHQPPSGPLQGSGLACTRQGAASSACRRAVASGSRHRLRPR